MPDTSANRISAPLSAEELASLCWELALLYRAGLSGMDSAALLAEESQPPRVAEALRDLSGRLAGGGTLSAALRESGRFPAYLSGVVELGEATGRMDQVLSALSDYYKREASVTAAVRRAVTYPAGMSALIALVFLVMVVRVLPVFSQVLSQLGASLPPLSLALLGAGSAGRTAALVLAGILLAGALLLLLLFRGDRGMILFSRGAVAWAVARGRFAASMALMLESGLPLDEAVERTSSLLEDSPLASPLANCRVRMAKGTSFPQAVEESGVLTGLPAGLLAAGFRAGAPDQAMAEAAQRCQETAQDRLDRVLSHFEYALVLVLCTAVGLMLLSVMLPLAGVLTAIG
ncbi:MAG: type II secretion system F family protein [Intestinimonas sp.]|nr:type II secretion system F family protein [Intestinimonas sp.]